MAIYGGDIHMSSDKQLVADAEKISEEQIQKVLEKYDADSKIRSIDHKGINWFLFVFAILFALYHFYATFNPLPTLLHRAIHLLFALGFVFLLYPTFKNQERRKIPVYDWILFGLAILSCVYLFVISRYCNDTRWYCEYNGHFDGDFDGPSYPRGCEACCGMDLTDFGFDFSFVSIFQSPGLAAANVNDKTF